MSETFRVSPAGEAALASMTPTQPGQPDLGELRRLAEAATGKGWAADERVTFDHAISPTVVLALLSRIEALETALAWAADIAWGPQNGFEQPVGVQPTLSEVRALLESR